MLDKPKFKSCFYVQVIKSVGVFLLSELDYFVLTGNLYELLTPLINGQNSVDEIVQLLSDKAAAAEVYYALMLMEQKGYIIESTSIHHQSLPSSLAIWLDSLNLDPTQAIHRLQTTSVSVTSLGKLSTQELIATLQAFEIKVNEHGDINIVLTDDYLHLDLEKLNREAIQSQRPWLIIKPTGIRIWLGPIFQPQQTGCWQCLAQRLKANRPMEVFIHNHKPTFSNSQIPQATLASTWQMGLNLAATEIAKWIVQGENANLVGNLITFDTVSLQTQHHTLVKRPQCPVCGESHSPQQQPIPVKLASKPKKYTDDGGHRVLFPEQTLQKYQHHISPITGAVRGLQSKSQVSLTPTYVAGHNFATMFDDLYFLRENLRGRSAGKGKTDTQAQASALCEALERYSGVFQGNEIRRQASYYSLGDQAIHPNICMNFSAAQYQTRHEWNYNCASFFHKVPEPFNSEQEIEWTPIWSLTYQDFKYLPTAYCYYGYPNSQGTKPSCWADSNGSAAGNTKEEAILQGFMELVERDAVAIWWYNRLKKPAVNLTSFDDPYLHQLLNYYARINRNLWILDVTSDLNIPTFAAVSNRIDGDIDEIILGFGAHFDPKIGILRAITELNQMLPAVLTTTPQDRHHYKLSDQQTLNWWQNATLANQPYLVPNQNIAPKNYADYNVQGSDDLREDVMLCVDIAAQHNLEMLVLDQTRPDIGLNVVKVIVPKMRHFWKRWASGRLYDVPVQLGWREKPLTEDQLNPWPMFF